MTGQTAAGDEGAPSPIIAVPPPPPALRDSVARLVVEILARRALADLGVIAHNDNHEPPR